MLIVQVFSMFLIYSELLKLLMYLLFDSAFRKYFLNLSFHDILLLSYFSVFLRQKKFKDILTDLIPQVLDLLEVFLLFFDNRF